MGEGQSGEAAPAKEVVVESVARDATLIQEGKVDGKVTGHTSRRSGANALARSCVSLYRVQWIGRWGGASVLLYVEEALEEGIANTEDERTHLAKDWDDYTSEIETLVREATQRKADINVTLEKATAKLKADVEEIAKEFHDLSESLRLEMVLNTDTLNVHGTVDFFGPPAGWETR